MDTATERARLLVPGLALVAAIVVVSDRIPDYVSGTSALIWALALGALIANSGLMRPSFEPGIRVASRRILRIGVALLGIRLSLGVVGDLGLRTIVVIVGSIVLTFVGDARDGPHPRRLGAAHAADRDRHGHLRGLRDRGHGVGQRGERARRPRSPSPR